jgi:hypothetical protein
MTPRTPRIPCLRFAAVLAGCGLAADAAALAECRSLQGLLLPDLETLDSEPLARRLAQQDHVFLPRLTPAIAATLAEGAGELSLPALERITPRALSALLRKADVEIPDVASLKLVPDPGGGADDFVDPRP